VDVNNNMKVDVTIDNEEEAITTYMPNMVNRPKGWNQEHTTFEEASRVSLFEGSTLSSLLATLFIMNCCCTHGTSNTFISKLLGFIIRNHGLFY
jgi:hypothetical protein